MKKIQKHSQPRRFNLTLFEVHAAESVAYLNRALVRLQDIWEEIGIPEEQRLQRTNDVHKHIKGLLDLMIAEEEELKKRVLKSIESCRKELSILCSELQMPPFEEDGCSMLQMEKNSRTRLEVMKEHKKQRMEELKSLVGKDRELCDIMCTTPFCIDQDSVPSLTQLESFRAYLNDLTKEKVTRRHFLKDRKAEKELLCSGYRTKIQELWERLQIPQEDREAFSEHMIKSKKKNIEALQAEVQRLEVLKMQSMQSVIEAIRAEIARLWEKCFYSPEQQEAFVPYHDDDFTEELLNLHEAEVSTLKKCYEDHKDLFEGVTKWQDNWSLYLELDKKANDPSRFNNRGGNLLKEEKQRSDLQKSLPKLEKSLKAQIDAWEQEHGKDFLVNGQKFLEYVQQQWDQHHNEKEKEKLERHMKKTKQIQEEMLYGTTVKTPSKRRLGGTPTPAKIKRLNGTSTISTPTSFLSSGLGGTMCHSSTQKPPLSAIKGLGLRTPGHGKTPRVLDRNKENISHLNRNTPSGTPLRSQDTQDHTFTFNSIAGSYSEFARDLSKASKANVKSGLLNSTVGHQ
uniref:Protein regulator of cytokinesis 1a n=1 Tax=Amphilophus citrinellus TaxID=61819 RepID=A0A3Q0S182_AMPCI